MRRVRHGIVAVLTALVVGLAALAIAYDRTLYTPPDALPPQEVFIRGGLLFDGTGAEARTNPGIVLRDGVIACVGGECRASAGAIEIDADGLAILPGFIDLHGHFFGHYPSRDKPGIVGQIWDAARMRPDLRRALLESGVTSYRSLGDPRDAVLETKTRLDAHELVGPRLFPAGPLFTAPGGHPAYGGRDPNVSGVGGAMTFQSDDPDTVRKEIELLAAQGVDGIKAVLHGNTSAEGTLPTLSVETFAALGEAARTRGLWVAVHVGPGPETEQAARAGATTIEHGVRQGNVIDSRALDALLEHDVIYVPTLGREPKADVNIPRLVEAGVPLGVGTDGEEYHDELARLVAAGAPASTVLIAATRNGALALGRGDVLGTVERGKLADLVLVSGEPWNDIRDTRSVVTVILGGRIVVDRRGQAAKYALER